MKRICVVGGGLAGVEALRHFQDALVRRPNVHVTFISPHEHFVYKPMLPDVAAGNLSARSAMLRLGALVDDDAKFTILKDRAEGLDASKGQVFVQNHDPVDFDELILATGTPLDMGPFAQNDTTDGFLAWTQAEHISRRVLEAFSAPGGDPEAHKRQLTFVVAGAGPAGVELAAELNASVRRALLPRASEAIRKRFRVILVDRRDAVLPSWSHETSSHARACLEMADIEVRLNDGVAGFDGQDVILDSGARIASKHLLWAAGRQAPQWLQQSGLPLSDDGRLLVSDTLEVPDTEGVFAVGDLATRQTGPAWPRLASTAARQGDIAADNALLDMVGASLQPFEHTPLGHMVRLGHQQALIELPQQRLLTGAAAWALVNLIHMSQAPTLTKKLAICADWLENAIQGQEWTRAWIE